MRSSREAGKWPQTSRARSGRPAARARRTARAESVRRRDGRSSTRRCCCTRAASASDFAKSLLPTYDVFDEDRYFEPYHGAQILELGGRRLGISICEDVWNDRDFWKRRRYHHDPIEELMRAGADAIVNLSASPFSVGKHRRREEMLGSMARKHHVPVVYVNQFGGNDDLVFDGRSLGFNADGTPIARGRAFEPDVVICDLDARRRRRAGQSTMPRAESRDLAGARSRHARLRPQVRVHRRRPRPVGRYRLGADRGHRRRGDRRRARARRAHAVALLEPRQHRRCRSSWRANLGIAHADAADRAGDARDGSTRSRRRSQGCARDVTEENIQARIRGNLLMALSNKRGALLLTTGNKSELSVGYCTLYGDMSGGLAVIADVPKTMVYRIARWLNETRGRAVIPEADADQSRRRPSSGRTRPIRIRCRPTTCSTTSCSATSNSINPPTRSSRPASTPIRVRRVLRMVRLAEFKRKQAAPGLKVTDRAFGTGWRMPIAAKVDDLESGD